MSNYNNDFSNNNIVYYSTYNNEYDALFDQDNTLFEIRKNFFNGTNYQKNKISKKINGVLYKYSYCLKNGQPLKWKKMIDNSLAEKIEQCSMGYKIVSISSNNVVKKVSYFDDNNVWVKTDYFCEKSRKIPSHTVLPSYDLQLLKLKSYIDDTVIDSCVYRCAENETEEEFNILNTSIGVPKFFCRTNLGDYYYDTKEYIEKREHILKNMRNDSYIINAESTTDEHKDVLEDTKQEPESVETDCIDELTDDTAINSTNDTECCAVKKSDEDTFTANNHNRPAHKNDILNRPQTAYSYTSLYHENFKSMNNNSNKQILSDQEVFDMIPKLNYIIEPLNCFTNDAECPYKHNPKKVIQITPEENYYYFGELENGLRHGRGKTVMPNGSTSYDGYYINDKRDGFGAYYNNDSQLCYVGGWKANQAHGLGITFDKDENPKIKYWNNGTEHGPTYSFDTKGSIKLTTRCSDDSKQSLSLIFNKTNGNLIVGEFNDGLPVDKGCEFSANGKMIYDGEFKEQVRSGFGVEYNEKSEVIYQGEWHNNKRHGTGKLFYQDHTYIGEFSNGLPSGKGTIYKDDGSYIEGKFLKWADANSKVIKFDNNVEYIISSFQNELVSSRS